MAAAASRRPLSHASPCVELFFQVVAGMPPQRVRDLLAAAWAYDPLTSLMLVFHLGVTGSCDKEGFHAAVLWIHEYHPKTLAYNLPALAEAGYLRGFPELLFRLIHGADACKLQHRKQKHRSRSREPLPCPLGSSRHLLLGGQGRKRRRWLLADTPMIGAQVDADAEEEQVEHGYKTRKKGPSLAAQALRKYSSDREYRLLLDHVAQCFADLLKSDVQHMRLSEYSKIGLAAKWCPTPRSFPLLSQAIARCLFPRNSDSKYADMPEERYTYRVLYRLHSEVLVPLRWVLQLPRVYLSSRQRTKLLSGKAKLTAVLPQTERQWHVMLDSLRERNLLTNCIAVCDMSKSMAGTPMKVCTALGLLISELGEYPWKGRVITFSEDEEKEPEITRIRGKTLQDKLCFLQKIQCDSDLSIDFRALFNFIFESILSMMKDLNQEQDKMIKTVFVFTNKGLDEALVRPWTQDYRLFCRSFEDAGYRAVVPQIVFWDLGASRSTAVTSKLAGVMTLRGFSNSLLKSFLENNGLVYPEDEMSSALTREEYKSLSLFD